MQAVKTLPVAFKALEVLLTYFTVSRASEASLFHGLELVLELLVKVQTLVTSGVSHCM